MIRISQMGTQHVNEVVAIHLRSFPGFFLTFLGPHFLRLLYSEIITMPDSVAIVAVENKQVVGFVAGVTHQSSFYGQLVRRRLLTFARASLSAAMRRPSIIPRLFRALSYSRSSQESVAQSLLMSIAVSPDVAGKGIGQQLVKTFLNEMQANGINSVSLTTDRDNNERTNSFYRKLGFKLAREFVTPEGRAMNEYLIQLEAVTSEEVLQS